MKFHIFESHISSLFDKNSLIFFVKNIQKNVLIKFLILNNFYKINGISILLVKEE